jgi:hypothetical protein
MRLYGADVAAHVRGHLEHLRDFKGGEHLLLDVALREVLA